MPHLFQRTAKSAGSAAFGLGNSASILAGVLTLVSALTSAQATTIFIGDGAAFGAAQPAGTGSRADQLSPLSYIFSSEVAGVSFTASSASVVLTYVPPTSPPIPSVFGGFFVG